MSTGRVLGLARHLRTQAALGFLLFKNSLLCNSTAIGLRLRWQLYSGRLGAPTHTTKEASLGSDRGCLHPGQFPSKTKPPFGP